MEKQIIELRKQGNGYRAIAKLLNVKRDTVRGICKRHQLTGEIGGRINQFGALLYEERLQKFINTFEGKFPGFEYHSGFKNMDSDFKCKCKKCGAVIIKNAQCARPSRKKELQCDNCNRLRIEQRTEQENKEREQKELTALRKKITRLVSDRVRELEREPLLHKECKRCGSQYKAASVYSVHCDKCVGEIKNEKEIYAKELQKPVLCKGCGKRFVRNTIAQEYCTDKCYKRERNRIRELRRNKRLKRNGKIDYNISLAKIIEKDHGICQLCGEPVDAEDYHQEADGNFIAGNKYPSIDHIIPVSKGGTHTWGNVQLAHKDCNSIKHNRLDYKVVGA